MGIAFLGIALTVTCDAQVRFRLVCRPYNCYLLPVNGLGKKAFLREVAKRHENVKKVKNCFLLECDWDAARRGDRLRWKEPVAYATNARYIKAQKILLRVLPQSAYIDSSLPGGAFGTGKFALYITLAICLSAIASFEPRDSHVVFILQQKNPSENGGIFIVYRIDNLV